VNREPVERVSQVAPTGAKARVVTAPIQLHRPFLILIVIAFRLFMPVRGVEWDAVASVGQAVVEIEEPFGAVAGNSDHGMQNVGVGIIHDPGRR
jgi:hypothetical protein